MPEVNNPESETGPQATSPESIVQFYHHYRRALEIARSAEEPGDFEEFARLRSAVVDLQRTKDLIESKQSGGIREAAEHWYRMGLTMAGRLVEPEHYYVQRSEEDVGLQAVIEECLKDIRRVREQMSSDQAIIDELKAQTKSLIAELRVAA